MAEKVVSAEKPAVNWKRKAVTYLSFTVFCAAFACFSDYNLPTGTGNLCLILFLAANVYIPAKYLRKRYRFSNVQPGADGDMTITAGVGPHNTDGNKWYVNQLKLIEVPEPATMSLLALGLPLMIRRRRQ